MKVSAFCFKVMWTAVVLIAVFFVLGKYYADHGNMVQAQNFTDLIWVAVVGGGAFLALGVIANIWES